MCKVIGQTFCLSSSPDYRATVWQQFGLLLLPPLTPLPLQLSLLIAAHLLHLSQTNGLLLAVKQDQLEAFKLTHASLTVIQLYFIYITLIESMPKNGTNKTQIRSYIFMDSKKTFAASKLFGPFLKVHLYSPQPGRRIQQKSLTCVMCHFSGQVSF